MATKEIETLSQVSRKTSNWSDRFYVMEIDKENETVTLSQDSQCEDESDTYITMSFNKLMKDWKHDSGEDIVLTSETKPRHPIQSLISAGFVHSGELNTDWGVSELYKKILPRVCGYKSEGNYVIVTYSERRKDRGLSISNAVSRIIINQKNATPEDAISLVRLLTSVIKS